MVRPNIAGLQLGAPVELEIVLDFARYRGGGSDWAARWDFMSRN